MPATVIVDVFSGLPNPEWTIAGDVLVQLKMMLAHLAQFHGTIPEPPGLGYRGLILEFSPHEGIEGPLRVFSGYVAGPHQAWVDSGHALERWLMEHSIRAVPRHADLLKQLLNQAR
jgi:hypothetical protein